MDNFVRAMLRSALVWLAIGILIGLSMAFWPGSHLWYKPGHAHANLLGFMSMFIFGVAYHVIPRFTGNPLKSRRLAALHVWVANVGLAIQVGGFLVRPHWAEVGIWGVSIGGSIAAIGAFMFIYNIWSTLGQRRDLIQTAKSPKLGG